VKACWICVVDQVEIITMRLLQRIKIVCLFVLVPAVLVGSSLGYSSAEGYVPTPNAQTDQDQNLAATHNLQQVEDGVPTVSSAEFKKLLEVLGLAIVSQGAGRHL
jgi:hypothetical protein